MKKILFLIVAKILLAQTLVIYSGVTMKYPVKEMAKIFEKKYPGLKVKTLFGNSGSLYDKMIKQKKCDIYFPGSDKLIKINPRLFSYIAKVGENELVVMIKKGNPKKIMSLNDLAKPYVSVIIGSNISSVGLKTKEVLLKKSQKFYNQIKQKAIVGYTSNEIVANVITDTDSGINWKALAYWKHYKPFVDIISIDKNLNPKCDLVMAVTSFASNKEMAKKFLEFAKSTKGQEIMRKWGF